MQNSHINSFYANHLNPYIEGKNFIFKYNKQMNESENRFCWQEFWHSFADVKTSLTNLTNGSYVWKNKIGLPDWGCGQRKVEV